MPQAPIQYKNIPNDDDNIKNNNNIMEKNKKALKYIEDVTRNADEIQERVLEEILNSSAHVEYLQRHGLNGRTDRDTFKKVIPVVVYEELKPEIDRIANGVSSPILCSKPISEFLTSSGTSGGERKLMPTIEDELERRTLLYSLLMPVMDQFVPNLDKGKGMYFLFIKSEAKTPGGLIARPVLTSYYKSSYFNNNNNNNCSHNNPHSNYTSPNETILCLDTFQSTYSQMLCGLLQSHQVLRVGAVFASGFIRAIKFLENNWADLCHDIRTGNINPRISDISVREAVMRVMKRPNPKLASCIEEECMKGSCKRDNY
ncbi:hypothetical protein PIB30_047350 [Stylosanthes scabra]|uniref:Uncharacterized protein n=1 Tax=Stylosanthes scabra TaxID=79078 RepID=A0ABU6TIP5_9FABA|nr:hypothetical protein [Stylosanthes scabra]